MAGYRPEYTLDEEKAVLKYIVDNREYHRLKGDRVWKDMEQVLDTERTWQSLKQHFRRHLVFKLYLPYFQLTRDQQELIGRSYIKKAQVRPRERVPNPNVGTVTVRPARQERVKAPARGGQNRTAAVVGDEQDDGERRLAPDFNEMPSSSDSDETDIWEV